jgi:hypothetical protein
MDCDTGAGRKPPATHKPQTCRRRAVSRLYRTPGTRTGMTKATMLQQDRCNYLLQFSIIVMHGPVRRSNSRHRSRYRAVWHGSAIHPPTDESPIPPPDQEEVMWGVI